MKNKISKFIFILIGIFVIYFLRTNFSEYNLKKTVSACVLAQKQTSKSFDVQKAKQFCEKSIMKQKEDWEFYLNEAAIFPPSTVRIAPVVFFEVAKWKNALATSSALTSFNNKFPFI